MLKMQEEKELGEINVTPFIDVMLVLLIIFMVVTPLMTSSIKVELPKTHNEAKVDDKKPVIIEISSDNAISIDNKTLDFDGLRNELSVKTGGNFDEVIYFYIDKSVRYEKIIETIGKVKEFGYCKVALSSQIEK